MTHARIRVRDGPSGAAAHPDESRYPIVSHPCPDRGSPLTDPGCWLLMMRLAWDPSTHRVGMALGGAAASR
ncbi:MAG: hypothetical protein ACO4CG_13405, partial [Prochlorothrix sp.]